MNVKKKIVFDLEIYKNYVLFSFMDIATNKIVEIDALNSELTRRDRQRILTILTNKDYTIVTFNGRNFDLPITLAAISGFKVAKLKEICDYIITTGSVGWLTMKHFNIDQLPMLINHVDIKEPAPGVGVSLKLYGARLHSKKLQDLPIEPDAIIEESDRDLMRKYCVNDLETTKDLYLAIQNEIELREKMSEQYKIDCRSLSGAQIAKNVFKKLLNSNRVREIESGYSFKYTLPSFVTFDDPNLQTLLENVKNAEFTVNDKGSVVLPDELKKVIEFGGAKYKLGIGGLHSQEKAQVVEKEEGMMFGEFDIASMYPNIILSLGLYPEHLGEKFLNIFRDIVTKRIHAKKTGNKDVANSLKLIANSSFGLFGNKYNPLYSPELLIQVTVTGQLFLLMAIERTTKVGAKVVSANTDGINVVFPETIRDDVELAICECEFDAGLEFEFTPYKATYNESVNSYVALTPNNEVKTKGFYASAGLMKNPTNEICTKAVINYLSENTPIEETIRNSENLSDFITARTVKGGGNWKGEYLGKVVRWIYSIEGAEITYKSNGNKVAKSDGCRPLMDLPDEFPKDINYQWYIDEANKMLKKLGVNDA